MKNIIKISVPAVFVVAATLFCTAAVSAQSNDYLACRCRQWNGSNATTLGVTLNNCCSLKQSGYNIGSYFSGTGNMAVQSGSNVTCKTLCPSTCPTGQTLNTSVHFSEDGYCCKTPCPSTCPTGSSRNTSISYSEDGACCTTADCSAYTKCTAGTGGYLTPANMSGCAACCGTGYTASTPASVTCGGNTYIQCSCTKTAATVKLSGSAMSTGIQTNTDPNSSSGCASLIKAADTQAASYFGFPYFAAKRCTQVVTTQAMFSDTTAACNLEMPYLTAKGSYSMCYMGGECAQPQTGYNTLGQRWYLGCVVQ